MKVVKKHIKAEIVCKIIEELADNIEDNKCERDTIYVYPFHNGRENGYGFTVWGKVSVFVTEHRNSDNIRITLHHEGCPEWERVTDEEYERSEYFSYNEYYRVAERVLELLDWEKEGEI